MTQTCPQCAAGNPSENRFCTHCGFSLEAFRGEPSQQFSKVCAGCGAINEPSFAYCHRCGLALPPTLHPRAEAGGSPAGFWIRLIAFLVDQVILNIVSITLAGVLLDIPFGDIVLFGEGRASLMYEGPAAILFLAVAVIYYTFAIGMWGRTPGKALVGLKVIRTGDARLSYIRAFARFWAYFLSALPLGLGFLSIPLSAQKRGWHDFLCDTRVVNTRKLG